MYIIHREFGLIDLLAICFRASLYAETESALLTFCLGPHVFDVEVFAVNPFIVI